MKMIFDTYEEFKKFSVDGTACPSDLEFKDTKKYCEPHSADCYECWKNCGVDIEIKERLNHKLCLIYSPSYERSVDQLDRIVAANINDGVFCYFHSKVEALFENGEQWLVICKRDHFRGRKWDKCLIDGEHTTVCTLNNYILPHAADGCRNNVEYF